MPIWPRYVKYLEKTEHFGQLENSSYVLTRKSEFCSQNDLLISYLPMRKDYVNLFWTALVKKHVVV